jgi:hypothetical protein
MVRQRHRVLGLLVGVCSALLVGAPAAAHFEQQVGPYAVEIGWQHEPTYVGQVNAVVVIIHDANGEPVTDLAEDDLTVVISTADQQSGALAFEPAFDAEEGEGALGQYVAGIVPTAPGDYTFQISGSIREQAVDITVTSGDATFDAVKGTSEIEFPVTLPTVPELVTRLDRIDARIEGLPQGGPSQADVKAAVAAAGEARQAAQRALLVGAGVGLAGVLVGLLGIVLALRARPRPA